MQAKFVKGALHMETQATRLMVLNKNYLIMIVLAIYSDFCLIYSIMLTSKHVIRY